MILWEPELYVIIKWHDYISFRQQGQVDQQPNFQGYHLTVPIFHAWETTEKSIMDH